MCGLKPLLPSSQLLGLLCGLGMARFAICQPIHVRCPYLDTQFRCLLPPTSHRVDGAKLKQLITGGGKVVGSSWDVNRKTEVW
jgi:hypothetical protein